MKNYRIMNGIAYDKRTPIDVIKALEIARAGGLRIRIFYGDPETGRSWMDEWGMMGTLGRSTGEYKIPLLITRRHNLGGAAILDHCIIRITAARGAQVLYSHPNFHTPALRVEPWGNTWGVFREAESGPHATFPTEEKARRWVDYITGRRNTK